MAATLLVCPNCAARFPAGSARCPHCGAAAVTVRAKAGVPVGRPYAPPPGYPNGTPAAPPEAPPSGPSRRALLLGLGGTGALLLGGAAVVIAVALSASRGKTGAVVQGNPPATARGDEARPVEVPRGDGEATGKEPRPPQRDPLDAPPPPTSLSAAEQQQVNEAIERGVAYLKKHSPAGPMGNHRMSGLHPLVGLTLLECGVPADDLALANLTKRIRADAGKLSETYSLSLTILFLDRLADPQDEPLIRHLAARLIAGQDEAGGWTYACPALSESDGQLLLTYLDANPLSGLSVQGVGLPLVVRPRDPSRTGPADSGRAVEPLSRAALPAAVKNRAVVAFVPGKTLPRWAADDNSNTQFAVLGVWAARRHGAPVERSVALIAARFRQSQNRDGSWGYNLNTTVRRDSMTCAGLLGLAVARAGGESVEKDPAIARGLQFLGQKVRQPGGVKPRKGRGTPLRLRADSLGDLYWLWSVERVGVIYNLATIGGKDWYAWGAGLLVAAQTGAGDWLAGQGQVVDTCFALLFLKRVNVAKDLTRQLQMIGPIRDPGLTRDR